MEAERFVVLEKRLCSYFYRKWEEVDSFLEIDDQVWSRKKDSLKILTTYIKYKHKKNYKTCNVYLSCANIKQKNLWLICIEYTIYTCTNTYMCVLPLNVYVFSEEETQTSIKMNGSSDLASQTFFFFFLAVSLEFCIQNSVRAASWDGSAPQTNPTKT